jgi:hypothetical protein
MQRPCLIAGCLAAACAAFTWGEPSAAAERVIRYFPPGTIYEYRSKLSELALTHTEATDGPVRTAPYALDIEEVTQNRGMLLLQSGAIDVIALGTDNEREAKMLPIMFDIPRCPQARRCRIRVGGGRTMRSPTDVSPTWT